MYGQIHSRRAASCQAIKQTQWKMMLLALSAAFSTSLRQPGSAGPCSSSAFLQRFAVPTTDPRSSSMKRLVPLLLLPLLLVLGAAVAAPKLASEEPAAGGGIDGARRGRRRCAAHRGQGRLRRAALAGDRDRRPLARQRCARLAHRAAGAHRAPYNAAADRAGAAPAHRARPAGAGDRERRIAGCLAAWRGDRPARHRQPQRQPQGERRQAGGPPGRARRSPYSSRSMAISPGAAGATLPSKAVPIGGASASTPSCASTSLPPWRRARPRAPGSRSPAHPSPSSSTAPPSSPASRWRRAMSASPRPSCAIC